MSSFGFEGERVPKFVLLFVECLAITEFRMNPLFLVLIDGQI